MAGGDWLDGVGFIEDDEIIFEQHPTLLFFIHGIHEREKEGMIHHQDIGMDYPMACPLKKADVTLLNQIAEVAAPFWGAESAFRANLIPDTGVGFDRKIA